MSISLHLSVFLFLIHFLYENRAEDWNLASPLASCSLDMLQKDDTLLINLLGDQPMVSQVKSSHIMLLSFILFIYVLFCITF